MKKARSEASRGAAITKAWERLAFLASLLEKQELRRIRQQEWSGEIDYMRASGCSSVEISWWAWHLLVGYTRERACEWVERTSVLRRGAVAATLALVLAGGALVLASGVLLSYTALGSTESAQEQVCPTPSLTSPTSNADPTDDPVNFDDSQAQTGGLAASCD